MVTAASPLLRIPTGTPAGVEGVTGIVVEAETLMHQNHGAWPTTLLGQMDRYIHVGLF